MTTQATPIAFLDSKDLARHERNMLADLTRFFGLPEGERPDVWVLGEELAKQGDKARWQAWTCEAMLYAVRELARGEAPRGCDWAVVVRCFGQAQAYLGRTTGFPCSCAVNEAIDFVRQALERKLRTPVAGVRELAPLASTTPAAEVANETA